MIGVQAYACGAFHPNCPVIPVDIGGFAWLWCDNCRVLCRAEAVAPKYEDYDTACLLATDAAAPKPYIPRTNTTNRPLRRVEVPLG